MCNFIYSTDVTNAHTQREREIERERERERGRERNQTDDFHIKKHFRVLN